MGWPVLLEFGGRGLEWAVFVGSRQSQSAVRLGGSSSCVSIRISRCSFWILRCPFGIADSGNTGAGGVFYELLCA